MNQYAPDSVTPPCETLVDVLDDRNLTVAEFAAAMGIGEVKARGLVAGKAKITKPLAVKLEGVFGVSALFWLNLERHYREFVARSKPANVKPDGPAVAASRPAISMTLA